MVTVPRPIEGSVGGRIRLVFGDDGNEWLLLIDHDNGDSKWQMTDWKGIPNAVAKQLNNCTEKGRDIKAVDFGPDGAWFINGVKPDGSGNHLWWGNAGAAEEDIKEMISSLHSPQASFGTSPYGAKTFAIVQGSDGYAISGNLHEGLKKRVAKIHKKNKKINFVRLFDDGQFFISDDEGEQWLFPDKNLARALEKNIAKEVAVAGDGSWVVIYENKYVSSVGVDKKLDKKLSKFFSDQRRWGKERRQEIRDANAANERERLATERAAREAAEAAAEEERAERERLQQEAREAAEQEAREDAERAEREAREVADISAAARISSLEAMFEERLVEEAKDIKETEAKLRMRKRSFRDTMKSVPALTRSRISLDDDTAQGVAETTSSNNTCVICRDEVAVMAVVPCGHLCLCIDCAEACMSGQTGSRSCPLCRGNMQSILRIYKGS
mmetsp:Transcript_32328/g.67815  ORF Transcript_32328/g.67815 Transcript_32328/m.67815 type:complete len:442 (+) Transcript_32328:93-1418(+)